MTEDSERTPRWVLMAGLLACLAVLVIAILLLTGRGGHGPGRHMPRDHGGLSAMPR